jgi:hypothetical protein
MNTVRLKENLPLCGRIVSGQVASPRFYPDSAAGAR